MIGMAILKETPIYDAVSGGADLVRWFGHVPSFHDAEILSLHLRRKAQSVLRLHGWTNTGTVGQDDYYVLDRHAIVTFTLNEVMDLQLDSFSIQNVIGSLVLRRAPAIFRFGEPDHLHRRRVQGRRHDRHFSATSDFPIGVS
jgi:hypothetical protein